MSILSQKYAGKFSYGNTLIVIRFVRAEGKGCLEILEIICMTCLMNEEI